MDVDQYENIHKISGFRSISRPWKAKPNELYKNDQKLPFDYAFLKYT